MNRGRVITEIGLGNSNMDKLQYDSFYKFMASIGVVLMTVPLLAIYYFLNTGNQFLISKTEYFNLTQESLCLLQVRYQTIFKVIYYLPWLCALLIGIGLLCFIYGCYNWHNIQLELDQQTKNKTIEQERSLRKMDEVEVYQKRSDEVNEALDKTDSKEILNRTEVNNMFVKMICIENMCYDYILQNQGKKYHVQRNIKVADKEFDIVSKSKKDNLDILYEVKYWFNNVTKKRLQAVVVKEEEKGRIYETYLHRNCRNIVLLVLPDTVFASTQAQHSELADTGLPNVTIQIFKESDLEKAY